MKLSALEKEILLHRFDAGVIAEVLTDDDDYEFSADEIEAAETWLAMFIRSCNALPELDALSEVAIDVLCEAIEGSTYLGCSVSAHNDREISNQKLSAANTAMDKLADKIAAHVGREVSAPTS